jgi:hypothetical protein
MVLALHYPDGELPDALCFSFVGPKLAPNTKAEYYVIQSLEYHTLGPLNFPETTLPPTHSHLSAVGLVHHMQYFLSSWKAACDGEFSDALPTPEFPQP